MLRCKSHVVQEFKRAKAQSVWPEHDPKSAHKTCGGKITLGVEIEGGGRCYCGDYCYCDSPEIKVHVTCTKCRNPFIDDGLQGSRYTVEARIGELLHFALEHEEN